MAFPTGWTIGVGPRPAGSVRSIRVFIEGTTTAAYIDCAYIFAQVTSANTFRPTPVLNPGDTAAIVKYGDLEASGTPMGAGPAFSAYPGDTPPVPMIFSQGMAITNTGGEDLYFSFDGVHDHGYVPANTRCEYSDRHEAGISFRAEAITTDFIFEAW